MYRDGVLRSTKDVNDCECTHTHMYAHSVDCNTGNGHQTGARASFEKERARNSRLFESAASQEDIDTERNRERRVLTRNSASVLVTVSESKLCTWLNFVPMYNEKGIQCHAQID